MNTRDPRSTSTGGRTPRLRHRTALVTAAALLAAALVGAAASLAPTLAFARVSAAVALDVYAAPNGSGTACTQAAPCSLAGARDLVRASNDAMTGDIVVHLATGTYTMSETFVLDGQDSGSNGHRVAWKSAGDGPVVFSGGRELTGWQQQPDGSYRTTVPDGTVFRQMWVEGRNAVRARTPRAGQYSRLVEWQGGQDPQRIAVRTADVPAIASVEGVEIVAKRNWTQHRLRVESITRGSDGLTYVTPKSPEREISFGATPSPLAEQTYFFENAPELLDLEGEFYLDQASDQVTYIPRAGQTMSSVYVPGIQTVLAVRGTPQVPARAITLSGITFAHASWTEPDTEGFVGTQAGVGKNASAFLPAAVEVEDASDVVLTESSFTQSGANGLNILGGSSGIDVSRSEFVTLAGQGIAIDPLVRGNVDATELISDVYVGDNRVHSVGLDYSGSVGIFAGYAQKLLIANNDVYDLPYTGISVGWGWRTDETTLRENVIRNNEIWNVMYLHDDGAGIYTISNQPSSQIARNYVHGVQRSVWADGNPVAGIYLDQGTTGYTVSENVLEDVEERIHQNKTGSNTITDSVTDADAVKAAAGARP
ncbi:MAG: right-handed parallel beta-helix repeat-containing protein [Dermatophilaceae bacterium]